MMKTKKILLLAVVCGLLFAATAQAGVSTFRQGVNGYTGVEDTWLNDSDVHDNYGAGSTLYTQVDAAGLTRRDTSAVKFDLSSYSIPGGEVLQSAVLRLYATSNTWSTSFNVGVHKALYSFNYGNGTGAGFGWGQATMSYNSFNNWRWGNGTGASNFSGPIEGIGANSDFVGTPDAIAAIPSTITAAVAVDIDITSLVNDWLANPAGNFGAFLIPERDTGTASGVQFRSADSPFTSENPLLTITTVPEPCTVALLGLGSLLTLKRKRNRS